MKIQLLTFINAFLLIIGVAFGQCNITLPANTVKVTQDSTIATNLGAGQNYLICSGATLTYQGTQSAIVNYYLESGAKVKSARSHQAVVWMKTGAEFDASYSESGNWAITNEAYYESGSTFIDHIPGSNLNECSQVVFNYGSVGSCETVTNLSHYYLDASKINVYPNPVSSKISVDFKKTGLKHIEIISVLGVQLASYSTDKIVFTTDLSHLQAGAYFLRVSDSQGNQTTRKFIVKR